MPEPLKNEFNESFAQKIGTALKSNDDSFDQKGFLNSIFDSDWESRELKDRMRHISLMIRKHTALDFLSQLKTMELVADQFTGLTAMTFPDFVEVHGLDNVSESLDALGRFTVFSSAEFAIRPFIIADETTVMKRMMEWSKDKNEHRRRLASEGCRPRLPWAMALPKFKRDPALVIEILENLKEDESLYVRKSVANNLNDIAKDNENMVLGLAEKWYGKNDNTNWIVKHGLRTLLKNGNERALQIIGFNFNAKFEVKNLTLSHTSRKIGESLHFSFEMKNAESDAAFAKIGFVVAYMKSNGTHSDKIFHAAEKTIEPSSSIVFSKKLSLKNLTTRKHYPGLHKISIVVNGQKLATEDFELTK